MTLPLINQRCTRCYGRYGVVPWQTGTPPPQLCACPEREAEIVGIVVEQDDGTLAALQDFRRALASQGEVITQLRREIDAGLAVQRQTVAQLWKHVDEALEMQREALQALQARCAIAEAGLDEARAAQNRLRGLVRHVESQR